MPEDPARPEAPPLRGTLIRGTALMVGMKWITRLMGLVNTAILARILAPTDFGVVAMCMLVVGVLEVLCELNLGAVLIQRVDATDAHWNSAFTLRFFQGIAVGLILVLARPLAVAYFGDDRVGEILPFLALAVVFQSLENIGVIAFRRDLDFRKDFVFTLSRKALAIMATIVAAVLLRNYWALVIGIILGNTMSTTLSYVAHPYRPRLTFAAVGELWGVSKWFILNNISYSLLLAVGRTRAVALTAAAQAILGPPFLWIAIRGGDVLAMTYVKVALTAVFLTVWFVTVRRLLGIPLRAIAARIYRPLLAGTVMYAGVLALRPVLPQGALAGLLTTIGAGAIVFAGSLLGFWRLAGSPRGAESFILEVVTTRLRRR